MADEVSKKADAVEEPVRDPVTGQLFPGHAPLPGCGRPPGSPNKITRSIREKVLEGFDDPNDVDGDGITRFVRELKTEYPPAAAGLLAKMIPSGDAADDAARVPIHTVNIIEIKSGMWSINNQYDERGNVGGGELVTVAEARRRSGLPPEDPVTITLAPEPSPPPAIGPPKLIVNNDNGDAA